MYTGKIISRDGIDDFDRVVSHDGKVLSLANSLKHANHSPTGFCWGYAGSGPAQLALAIMLEELNGDVEGAKALYQDFKFMVVAKLPMDDDFALTDEQVSDAITLIRIEQMKRA